jgi:hypothetical protein
VLAMDGGQHTVAGGAGAWGSALSARDFAAIRSVGFEPAGQVFGAAVYYLSPCRAHPGGTDYFAEAITTGTAIARFAAPRAAPPPGLSVIHLDADRASQQLRLRVQMPNIVSRASRDR